MSQDTNIASNTDANTENNKKTDTSEQKTHYAPNIPAQLLKPYDPTEVEPRVQKEERESGFYNPDVCIKEGITKADAPVYSIILPPPNVTGTLHMGHALGFTTQDIVIRYKRMKGNRVLWIPGTDHASIATQSMVEKNIQKAEGLNRHDLGREELLKRVDTFAKQSHDTIVSQLQTIGASVDWSREAFTLDEERNFAVRTVFKKMYDDGLIFKKNRVINWDPKGQTTISDDEIVYEDRKAKFYTFKYSKDFPIAISTTRPETKLGDVAVAVNPEDPRYKEFVGKEYSMDFCGAPIKIKIVADHEAEMDFGTGAVGITPAHSMTDYQIAMRHGLPMVQVIDEKARMMIGSPEIVGKKVAEARELVVAWLKENDLLIDETEIDQRVSTAERTGGIIEPLPKLQWFVAVNKKFKLPHSDIDGIESGSETTLKEIMQKAVLGGQIEMMPEHFLKTYFNWIDNLNDWCISRQIWYGHRIPVWYKKGSNINQEADSEASKSDIYCGLEAPTGDDADQWIQDEDTLDTWFSSGLWSFSTMGWPAKANDPQSDFAIYHPTNLLVTGHDIIFFWVARMILMTGYVLGTIPFSKVLFTGMVRDMKGRKFSKTLGNGIDPIEIAQKFGMDAGRMSLVFGTAPGTDSKIDENKIKGYKHFANKIWNVTRFILTSTEGMHDVASNGVDEDKTNISFTEADLALIEKRNEVFKSISTNMDNLKIHIVAEDLYNYTWKEFADVILESSKEIFANNDESNIEAVAMKKSRAKFLLETLAMIVKTLHPFMPHVTQELWSLLPKELKTRELIMTEKWPTT
ncbi:MAG: valine--tRNA ligase [bacterium]